MKSQKSKIILQFSLLFCFFLFAFCIFTGEAKAASASLYLSPSTGNYTVGNTFLIQAKVNSGGVAVNATDGTLVFNPDKLEVKSISKIDSAFTLWVQEPTFSNSLGTVNFAGGKPSPGFTGAAGIIFTITFKARTATIDPATVTFASGSVLADDGKGTNILGSMGSGSYKLIARTITPIVPEEEEYIPPTAPGQTPAAPVISSPTHPDENSWYSNNDPEFNWELPSDVTGVSLLLNDKPTSNPGQTSDGLLQSKKYEDVQDGTWYFHIKFQNQYGWGSITHRKVLIDTENPASFEVTVDNEGDPTNPSPSLYFQSTDEPSGIDYYEIRLNDKAVASTTSAGTKGNAYRMPPQPAEKYALEVRAIDKAGNFSWAKTDLEIASISIPKITKIPERIEVGEILEIEGEATPKITVRIYIQKGDEAPLMEKVNSTSEGEFALSYDRALTKGDYVVWAQAEDERGALSYPGEKHPLQVGLPVFLRFGKIALDYLTTMITLIVLIVGAILVIFYTWYRVSMWRKRVAKETKEVSQSVAGAFRALREEVEEQISMLDKKPGLTKEEKAIRDKLQEALDISEKFISEEIKDVEKELE